MELRFPAVFVSLIVSFSLQPVHEAEKSPGCTLQRKFRSVQDSLLASIGLADT
jgi:hypothetical protein